MSLHFNWGRLDETCAEALRHLINKRLAEMVDHINSQNTVPSSTGAAVPAAMAAKPSTPQPPTVPGVAGAVASCPAGSHGAGAGKAEGSLHVSGIASRQEAVAGLTTIPGGVPNRATSISGEPISNLLPNSTWTSTASLHPSGTPVSNSGVALPGFAASAPAPTAAVPSTGSVGGSVGVGGSSIAGTNVSLSGPAISSATPLHNCGYHGVGAAPPLAETNASNGVGGPSESTSLAGEPISVTASAANRSVLSHSSPGLGPTSSTAATSSAAAAADAEGAKKRIPPIVYLEVGRVEWGTSPPFIEIVAFENAIDGPPGSTRQRIPQEHLGRGGLFGGGRDGQGTGTEARGSSPYTVCRTTSMDTLAFSTAALDPGAGLTAVADSPSEGSHGLAPRLHTGVNTSHLFVGSHLLLDEANAAAAAAAVGGGSGARADMPPCKPPSPSSHAQCSSHPEPVDSLASVLGPGGLYVRLHVTYGGAMHLSLNIAVQHEIRLGAVALRLSLPMMFYLANLDLDCYVCVNIKDSMCEVWLEPGPLSPSIVNRLSIIATVGGDDAEGDSDFEGGRKTSGTGDYGASSADFYSRFGGSSVSDVDGGEEGNGVYMNEHEVSQFVLHELRAVLRETLIAPHSIRIPISFG
ncbi:hypothetical protein JKF63_03595 [Porcisia hertigi]|uniref:SMP-LTD domain-containing protein n=1 Tax=Porcisia hertigi TaxID=2761500 RepID=A0A836ILL7_9TRYP|nr:hypothetical protein JKF63_03595 [Porcisia hertigi]